MRRLGKKIADRIFAFWITITCNQDEDRFHHLQPNASNPLIPKTVTDLRWTWKLLGRELERAL
jgi:hypothetical protein